MRTAKKEDYFAYMRETAKVVSPLILANFKSLEEKDKRLFALTEPLLSKRIKIAQLRPVIMRLSYEICGGRNWKQIAGICAAMEIHNMYLYFHNWIFDNKKHIWQGKLVDARNSVTNTIIAASLARELIVRAIYTTRLSLEKKLLVSKEITDNIIDNYYGFLLDINLTTDKISEYRTNQTFLEIYERKSRLLSGNMYSLSSKLGAILADASKEKIEAATVLGDLLGTGLHISNDLGDFAQPRRAKITFGKSYQDQLADIRENRLTLPIYYVLKYGNESEKESLLKLVDNYHPTEKQICSAVEALHTSGSYDYSKKYIRSFFNKAKHRLHTSFEASDRRNLYAIMLSVIRTNKFLAELREPSSA